MVKVPRGLLLPSLKALLGTLLIPQVVQHPGQPTLRVAIVWGHRQHPFIERFGLAQFV